MAAVIAAIAFVIGLVRLLPASRASAPALAMIPPGPAFVLTLDVAQLKQSQLENLLRKHFSELGGLGQRCGFEPVQYVKDLAIAVPGAGNTLDALGIDDFGVVAMGPMSRSKVLRCAEHSIVDRKGEPVQTRIGKFSTIRDQRKKGGELAIRDGGPLILSGGNYFRELLDAAESSRPGSGAAASRDALHAELRQKLGRSAPLLMSWVLPQNWTERFVPGHEARLSPLTEIRAVGLAATFRPNPERGAMPAPSVDAILACGSSAGCSNVAAFLEELQRDLNAALALDPTLQVLTRVKIHPESTVIRLQLLLSQAELKSLLELALGSDPRP